MLSRAAFYAWRTASIPACWLLIVTGGLTLGENAPSAWYSATIVVGVPASEVTVARVYAVTAWGGRREHRHNHFQPAAS